MRVRNFLWLLAILGACANSVKAPTLEMMERKGWGSPILVTTRGGARVFGELIAIDRSYVYVLQRPARPGALVRTDLAQISTAKLYRYESEGGFGGWGILGALSTLSHGFILLLSAPVWLVTTGVVGEVERSHVVMSYPGTGWSEFGKWARFPQGLPPSVDEQALSHPRPPPALPPMQPPSASDTATPPAPPSATPTPRDSATQP